MTTLHTNEVFGVHKDIKTYVERKSVDDKFKEALQSDKQILVYGSSKQGKTALVTKYCGYDENIVYQITPETDLTDIYNYVLRNAGVTIKTEYTEGTGKRSSIKIKAKILASFAIFGKGEAETGTDLTSDSKREQKYVEIPFNIDQPQDVSDLLKKVHHRKIVILENFHYLPIDKQKQFAFDLRAFQELAVRFILLGVWRERNRLSQFNGDLLDRVVEIPVEPWEKKDFSKIVSKGEELLNIKFSSDLANRICEASFSSVGVFQDLLKSVCQHADINIKQTEKRLIDDLTFLEIACKDKAESYGDRHKRALQSIAAGTEYSKLNLPYYIVQTILKLGINGIINGLSEQTIFEEVKNMHNDPNNIEPIYIRRALVALGELQVDKQISPPVLAYDDNSNLLQVVDSTLYFYLKNANLREFSKEIKNSYQNGDRLRN